MASIRAGETLALAPIGGYDPRADEAAARAAHRRAPVEHDSYLNKAQLAELRRVQNERIEAGKMKQLGLKTSANMGVRCVEDRGLACVARIRTDALV